VEGEVEKVEFLVRKESKFIGMAPTLPNSSLLYSKPINYMKRYILFVLTLLASSTFAQYFGMGKVDEVKEIQSRPLILMLEEVDPKVAEKYSKKPAELSAYQEEIERTNQAMIEAVTNFWTFTKAPAVKKKSEVDALIKAKNKQYAILALDRIKITSYVKDGMFRYNYDSKVVATTYIDLIENLYRGNPVYFQNLPNEFPSRGDITIGIEMMQNFLTARLEGKKRNDISDEADEATGALTTKTLYLDKADLKNGLTEAQIKETYPYPFKIVTYDEIEKLILSRDKNGAVVQIIPLSVGVPAFIHFVAATENGKTLAFYKAVQASFGGKSTEGRVTLRHLKSYPK
jgi:hypothetical protein